MSKTEILDLFLLKFTIYNIYYLYIFIKGEETIKIEFWWKDHLWRLHIHSAVTKLLYDYGKMWKIMSPIKYLDFMAVTQLPRHLVTDLPWSPGQSDPKASQRKSRSPRGNGSNRRPTAYIFHAFCNRSRLSTQ